MKKKLLNNEILLSELRKNDAFFLKHVQGAYFENNGHLSVLTYPESQPVTRKDLKFPIKETICPRPIISDGEVDVEKVKVLTVLKKYFWAIGRDVKVSLLSAKARIRLVKSSHLIPSHIT